MTVTETIGLILEDWAKVLATHAATLRELEGDRLLTAAEAAEVLGVSPGHVYANAERYPFTVQDGRLKRFSQRGLQAYLREQVK